MLSGKIAVMGAVLVGGLLNSAQGAPVLSGAIAFNATGTGAYDNSLIRWNTVGGDLLFNLYFQDAISSAWVNSGNSSGAALNVNLSPGAYIFFIFGEPGLAPSSGFMGLNLFFDGATAVPDISAFNAFNGVGAPAANSSPSTLQLDGTTLTTGAGTLSFTSGGNIVTLSAFTWNTNAPGSGFGNVVSNFDNVPSANGTRDFWGAVRLDVVTEPLTGIPEPGTLSLVLGAGLVGIWSRRKR